MKISHRTRPTCKRDYAIKLNTKRLEKTIMRRVVSLSKACDRVFKYIKNHP